MSGPAAQAIASRVPAAFLLVSALVAWGGASAQTPVPAAPGRIVGELRDQASGLRVGYGIVSLPALGVERFTDAEGGFVIAGVPAGTHQLRVRRVGFEPRDTTVTVEAGAATGPVRVALRQLAVRLSPVQVRARAECVAPGATPADPEAAAVVGQLRQNAERARLLATRHPYAYLMERLVGMEGVRGQVELAPPETIIVTSQREWRYLPGALLTPAPRRGRGFSRAKLEINLPNLEDLADSAFVVTHCFDVAGTDTLFGGTFVRVDVQPWTGLRAPDVRGAVYLDTASYQIRWAVLELTRIPPQVRGLRAVRLTAQYREILPSLPVIASARGDYVPSRSRSARDAHPLSEEQTVIAFQWTGTPP